MRNKNFKTGFGLIEIVVATALISGSLFALALISQIATRASSEGISGLKGTYLAEEAMEAVRSIRDDGWTVNIKPLFLDEIYYPSFSFSKWSLSTTSPGLIDGYDRQVIFEEVWRRSADDNIIPAESVEDKYIDPDTLKLRITVSWPKAGQDATSSVQLINYLANVFLD